MNFGTKLNKSDVTEDYIWQIVEDINIDFADDYDRNFEPDTIITVDNVEYFRDTIQFYFNVKYKKYSTTDLFEIYDCMTKLFNYMSSDPATKDLINKITAIINK